MTHQNRKALPFAVLGAALAAWIVAVQRMRGMDAGPGTDLGSLGWYVGIWVTMMAAMMLPSTTPTVLIFSRVHGAARSWLFVLGYLLAWTAFGLVAYAVYRVIRASAPGFLAWDDRGPWVAGGALVVAGLFQLTPLKQACLRHCRSPLRFLLRGRSNALGAVWLGIGHGGYCVGCCAGLMLALFALGVMSLFWMVVVAAAIFVEKALPGGEAFSRLLALTFVALGIWVAVSPATAPEVKQPTHMLMRMQR